ncbi:MAG TPA: hypothetical protein VFA03_05875 [Acetobacteraceae bacterium]|nr:hypothetical protein [Acetobacteraceae bacterium]
MRLLKGLFVAALAALSVPPAAHAGIGGFSSGSSVNGDGPTLDVTVTTINASFVNFTSAPTSPSDPSNWVLSGAAAWPGYTFVDTAQAGVQPISASDFTIVQYNPWVVNQYTNPAPGTNYAVGLNGSHHSRNVINQNAGGADFVLSYTPTAGSNDPTTVNFLQAYVQSVNGGAFTSGTIDTCSAASPYYNKFCVSGTDHNGNFGVPLNASGSEAWMLDIPYRCSIWPAGGANAGCPAAGSVLTSETEYFITLIESDSSSGAVLYGGIEWGYNLVFAPHNVPEPSTLPLLGPPLALLLLRRRHRA